MDRAGLFFSNTFTAVYILFTIPDVTLREQLDVQSSARSHPLVGRHGGWGGKRMNMSIPVWESILTLKDRERQMSWILIQILKQEIELQMLVLQPGQDF